MKTKQIFTLLLSLLFVVALAACNNNTPALNETQGNTSGTATAAQNVELTTCESTDFISFTPCGHSGGFQNYSANIYETLVEYEDGEIKPLLAESWEVNGNEITLKLRQGVKFSDGEAFNAEVVKLNLDSLYKYQYDSVSWFQVIGLLDHVDVVDEYTVKIVLTQPYYAALNDLASRFSLGMMSPAAFEVEGNPYENVMTTAGTGPYIITDYKQGSYYVFARNENYWGDAPAVEKLTVNIVPDMDSRIVALRSGEADFLLGISNLSYNAFDELKNADGLTGVVSENHSKSNYILFNSANPVLQDIQVRQAVAEAIDKETLITGVLLSLQDNADYMFDPDLPYCNAESSLSPYEYSPEDAAELLDDAGWTLNSATGIREKDGAALTLKLTYVAGYGSNDELAQVMKSQLAKVGIELTLESYDTATWASKFYDGGYDLALAFSYGVPYDPHITLNGMIGQDLADASMQSFDFKANLNASITELLTTSDSAQVEQLIGQAIKTIHTGYGAIPLTYENELAVYNSKSINGITFFGQPGMTVIKNITPAQ